MQILACQKVKMYLFFFQRDAIKASVMTICFWDYDHVLPSRLSCCHFIVPSIILSPTLGLFISSCFWVFFINRHNFTPLYRQTHCLSPPGSDLSRIQHLSSTSHPPSLSRCAFSPHSCCHLGSSKITNGFPWLPLQLRTLLFRRQGLSIGARPQ